MINPFFFLFFSSFYFSTAICSWLETRSTFPFLLLSCWLDMRINTCNPTMQKQLQLGNQHQWQPGSSQCRISEGPVAGILFLCILDEEESLRKELIQLICNKLSSTTELVISAEIFRFELDFGQFFDFDDILSEIFFLPNFRRVGDKLPFSQSQRGACIIGCVGVIFFGFYKPK